VEKLAMSYFAYPSMFLWLIAPLAALAIGAWTVQRRKQLSKVWGESSAVLRMLPPGLARRRRWIAFCRVAGLFFIALALAGPLIGSKLVEFHQKGLDVFIAVDTSLSMQAQDFKPSRMAHAKLLLGELIERLAGSRVGIVAFAGRAAVECPLTIDTNAARQILETIDVGDIPLPGTAIGDAIRISLRGLKSGESNHRALVILTDGEDHHSDPAGAAKEAAGFGVKIFPVGIGNPQQGEPIPLFDDQGHRTDYKRDKKGEIVLSRIDESALSEVARTTGGQYFRASSGGAEIDDLVRALEGLQQGNQKTKVFDRYENRYQWPLAIGVLFLFLSLMIPEARWKKP
jgi:Ca-activated chloride channel family protein